MSEGLSPESIDHEADRAGDGMPTAETPAGDPVADDGVERPGWSESEHLAYEKVDWYRGGGW